MPRARGLMLGLAACTCLLVGACAEGSLVTPTPTPAGHSSTDSGTPSGSAAGESSAPSQTPSVGVVDESAGRSDDGLPKVVDGQQVRRGKAAIDFASSTSDSTPFLLGGWVTPAVESPNQKPCPSSGCGDQTLFADAAGTIDAALDKQVDFQLLTEVSTLIGGPLVVEVHTHDPQAACSQSSCDNVMVADKVVWTGDSQTDPRPLSLDDATTIITGVFGDTAFQAMGSPIVDCGHQLPASQLLVAIPPEDESGASAPHDWIASVNVAPSADAMTQALKTVAQPKTPAPRPGVENVFTKANLVCRTAPGGPFRTFRWFIAENVAVLVATSEDTSLEDRVYVQQLGTAFDDAINGSPGASESPIPSESAIPSASASASTQPSHKPTPKPTRKP